MCPITKLNWASRVWGEAEATRRVGNESITPLSKTNVAVRPLHSAGFDEDGSSTMRERVSVKTF